MTTCDQPFTRQAQERPRLVMMDNQEKWKVDRILESRRIGTGYSAKSSSGGRVGMADDTTLIRVDLKAQRKW